MRIGYCSPFNPMKSGISDFSEELVFALAKHMEVVIFSPVIPSRKEIINSFEVHFLADLDQEKVRNTLDLIIYHIGNNVNYHGEIVDMLEKYPGIIELHELGLHHLAAARTLNAKGRDAYMEMVQYCHGERGVKIAQAFFEGNSGAPWNEHAMDMCMARPLIERATGVIVHAEMVKQMVLGIREDVPIANIMHHSMDIVDDIKQNQIKCRNELNLPRNQVIIGSFGFATSAKRVLPILNALARLKKENVDFLYVLVGEVAKEIDIQKELRARNLSDCVRITGFASLEDFKLYMGACDFCLNLRYPTQGESSGSLHRMLGMGKPIIVTDIGTFADYPDDVVLKVRYDENEVDDIYEAVFKLLEQKEELKKRGEKALVFAKEQCDLEKNARKYNDFFHQVHAHTWQAEYEDTVISHLCELGLTEPDYLEAFYSKMGDCLH